MKMYSSPVGAVYTAVAFPGGPTGATPPRGGMTPVRANSKCRTRLWCIVEHRLPFGDDSALHVPVPLTTNPSAEAAGHRDQRGPPGGRRAAADVRTVHGRGSGLGHSGV